MKKAYNYYVVYHWRTKTNFGPGAVHIKRENLLKTVEQVFELGNHIARTQGFDQCVVVDWKLIETTNE